MPHQCLKCGKSFAQGSNAILKGCPYCGGTRFFFTKRPLSEEEREELTKLASRDIKLLVRDILTKEPRITEKAAREEWFQYKPMPQGGVIVAKERRILGVKKVKKARRKDLVPKITKPEPIEEEPLKPEVVNILESGVYEIDVESLLEESPVIVKRDGTYLIHLPSLFEKLLAKK